MTSDDFKDFIEAIYASGVSSSMDFMTKVYREIVTEDFSNAAYERFLKIFRGYWWSNPLAL